MSSRRFVLACAAVLMACGGSKPPAAEPPPSAKAEAESLPDRDEAIQICMGIHEKAAECAGEFIDAVLSLRAKYQPEFAQALADPAQAKTMRERGMQETIADGTGPVEQRRARCAEFVDHGPPANSESRSITKCFDIADCGERTSCMMPSLEARMAEGGYQPPDKRK